MRPWRLWRAIRRTLESWPDRRPSPDTQWFAETAPKGWRQRLVLRLRTRRGGSDRARPVFGRRSLPPCDCSIDAAFDSHQSSRISAGLEVVVLQEILSHHGELKAMDTAPAETDAGGSDNCAHVAPADR